MAAKLSVNLNAIAMLRNRRDLPWPSVTGLGRIALQAGKSGGQRPLAVRAERRQRHSVLSGPPSAACAAASRAIGTR